MRQPSTLYFNNKGYFYMVSSNLLLQPARLNLRWLSNGHGPEHEQVQNQDFECNNLPATSPICGWLLPNHLDRSLLVFDSAGCLHGSFDIYTGWFSGLDGDTRSSKVEFIPNQHLRRVVQWIETSIAADSQFLSTFLSELDLAMETIARCSFSQIDSISVLLGRPIAVARVSVGFELKELSAINHDLDVYRQPRIDSDCVQNVQFQFNEGLVGFWRENIPEGSLTPYFYSSASDKKNDDGDAASKGHVIETYQEADAEKILDIQIELGDTAQVLTMLIDPRGGLTGSCDNVPNEVITIPAEQYAAALQAMELLFMTAPVLQKVSGEMPIPTEAEINARNDFRWGWLDVAKQQEKNK
jgi:hypothetical protein